MKNEMLFLTLGKCLAQARKQKGYSQAEIAGHFNYNSPQFVSNWERGKCIPPTKILPKLTKILELEPEKILKIIVREHERYFKEILELKVNKHRIKGEAHVVPET